MSQVITNAFEQYWQSSLAAEQPVVLDEFILADIPDLDITSPIDPDTGLPPESQIVHRQNVDQRGRINSNAVAYSIVMDTTVGDFSFNAMFLRNKANGVIGMIVYKGRETKLKTDQTTGQTGNSLVKSMLMGYDQAAEATLTHVDAGTWQIDYAARLRGQDEDLRQLASQLYGHHTFIGDGFKVVEQAGVYQVSKGVAIVGGLRVELEQPENIYPGTKPIGVWVDVHRSGSLLSEHQNHFTIITSVADLTDHIDGNGYQHYMAKLGTVQADSTVVDNRGQGGNSGAGGIPDTFALWKRSMAEAGYNLVQGSFENGGTVTNANDVLLHLATGSVLSWNGTLPKTVPAKSTPDAGWSLRGGELLRSQLLEKRVYAIDFGRVYSDGAVNTRTIQLAADFVYAAGGGIVDLGPYKWLVDASTLNETYDNYGVPVAASTGCVILRKAVSLIGQPGRTKLYTTNKNATPIYMIAPEGNVVSGLEIDGGWNPGDAGGNNGIFQLGTPGGDTACDRVTFSDLYIHNVASYGLALQNGNPRGCSIARIRVDNIGADGLDLKARGDLAVPAQANSAEDIWVSRYNQRVDGSAGVDVRGIWHLRGITVTDFGGNASRTYVGIRFRTKPAPVDPQQVADKSTLDGFTIRPTIGSAALSLAGIECGSDDTHISNGTVEDCHHGVIHTGNVNGSAIRGTVTDVTSINARQYGFRNAGGTQGIKYVGCEDVGAATAGFRVEGDNCTTVGCTGTLSVSAGALPTFMQTGCKFGASFVVLERQTDTSVSVTAKGTATDIALRLSVKGTSFVGFNGDLRPDTANTKYLGSGSLPMAGGFTQTAHTVTSDERCKTAPLSITDVMLDAAAEVDWVRYQYLERVEAKGPDGARWHFGAVAQRYVEAFARHGIDAHQFGFLCYDEWAEQPEEVQIIEAILDKDGTVIEPERIDVLQPAMEAGSRYGIRYEEALALEAALQRRNYQRLLTRIETLEAN